jgi:hypothetical protein
MVRAPDRKGGRAAANTAALPESAAVPRRADRYRLAVVAVP